MNVMGGIIEDGPFRHRQCEGFIDKISTNDQPFARLAAQRPIAPASLRSS